MLRDSGPMNFNLKDLTMKKFLVVILLAVVQPLFAADKCTTWGCISTIKTLYTNASGPVYIGTPLDETLANCKPVSDVYFKIEPSMKNFKELYAQLLAAYMSGSKIQLRVQENTDGCLLSYVRSDTAY